MLGHTPSIVLVPSRPPSTLGGVIVAWLEPEVGAVVATGTLSRAKDTLVASFLPSRHHAFTPGEPLAANITRYLLIECPGSTYETQHGYSLGESNPVSTGTT